MKVHVPYRAWTIRACMCGRSLGGNLTWKQVFEWLHAFFYLKDLTENYNKKILLFAHNVVDGYLMKENKNWIQKYDSFKTMKNNIL